MRKRRHLSFWDLAELIPPILARLLARKLYGRPLFDTEIASRSGLPVDEVFLLQHKTNWKGIDVVTMRRFLTGCGIDFCDGRAMNRIRTYLSSRPTWKHLRVSPEWKSRYEPLLRRYIASRTTNPQ